MAMTRRTLLTSATFLAAGPGLVYPAMAQARQPLRVQCLGGLVEKTIRDDVVPAFEKAYPYDVSITVEDDVNILPKLQIARTRAPYDVCMMDNDKAILGSGMGVWAPDHSARLKNIGDVYESCKPPVTANYNCQIYEYGLVFNTDKFKTAPTSWADLWQPGIVAGVPHASQSYGLTFLYVAALMNGGSATNLEPGFAAIKRLGNFKVYKNVSQGLSLFQQKEIDGAMFYSHRGQQMIEAGLPIGRTIPKEGTYGQRTGLQIPRLTGNMDGALAWIDTMLAAPTQMAFAKSLYSPTNRLCVFPPEQEKRLILGEAHVNSIREAPWKELVPQRDAILDRWTREFG
jgi:putative spermidine/putrescine transport system substrate-binding protein